MVELKIQDHFNIPKLHAILHYMACIHTLGSADGYNTESPERLHIDFAKDTYRASNKRDYTEQMALWLQRHEAMWLWESYLIWIDNRLGVEVAEKNKDFASGGGASDKDEDNKCSMKMTTDINYFLAMRPPFQNTTVDIIQFKFGAIDFISTLSTFLCNTFQTTVLPSIHD